MEVSRDADPAKTDPTYGEGRGPLYSLRFEELAWGWWCCPAIYTIPSEAYRLSATSAWTVEECDVPRRMSATFDPTLFGQQTEWSGQLRTLGYDVEAFELRNAATGAKVATGLAEFSEDGNRMTLSVTPAATCCPLISAAFSGGGATPGWLCVGVGPLAPCCIAAGPERWRTVTRVLEKAEAR